jgi:hypothetical protein
MSWAVGRTTSRVEDSAYYLLGIFGVHRMTTYGIGEAAAFANLQELIIKIKGQGHSMLAGSFLPKTQLECGSELGGDSQPIGVLVPSPSVFKNASLIYRRSQNRTKILCSGLSGGYIHVRLALHSSTRGTVSYGELRYGLSTGEEKTVAIPVIRLGDDNRILTYARTKELPVY